MSRQAALAVITLPTTRIKKQQREQDYQESGPERQEPYYYLNRHRGIHASGIQQHGQVADAVVNVPRREDASHHQRPPAARVNAPRADANHRYLKEVRKGGSTIPGDYVVVASGCGEQKPVGGE